MAGRDRYNKKRSRDVTLKRAYGEALIEDTLFHPDTIRVGLDILAGMGAGELAFTPELRERYEEILERRFMADDGGDAVVMPHYGVLESEDMRSQYGVINYNPMHKMRTERETNESIVNRLLIETAREAMLDVPGLRQMLNLYSIEAWARWDHASGPPLEHADPDITLFRNPTRGWTTIDIPIATNDKSNTINLWESGGLADEIYPSVHPAWTVDRRRPPASTRKR